jgi:ATP-dependent exoDNAse (exonuclease V) alpha subunit
MRKLIMAIYHLNGKIISRGKGHNAVAAAAYRYAGKFFDERCNRTWNFENKKGVVHTEINFPTNSPVWVKEIDSAKLWNMVEKREGEVDSQLARSIVFALPIELTQEQNIILAREFIKDEFAARGMIADWCVHYDDPSNPHVHLMLTMRELKESGFGIKVREWNAKLLLITWRSKWAEYANRHLKLHQHNTHIDHRSLKDQGIDLIPTVHRGRATDEINRRGKYAERKNEFNEIKKENLSRILKNPDLLNRFSVNKSFAKKF